MCICPRCEESVHLQDAATTTAAAAVTAANLPGLPGLPSNALTDTLGYLHAHPQLRSALITFLKADSTKEFLATVTQLAIKIKPQEVAALVSHHHTDMQSLLACPGHAWNMCEATKPVSRLHALAYFSKLNEPS